MYNKTTHKKQISDYTIDQRKFWSRVNITDNTKECWNWMGAKNTGGYGLFHVKSLPHEYEITGRTYTQLLAHRVAASLVYPELPPEKYACHTCDNPACCNPHHLWIGSAWDNVHDMIIKGRARFDNRKIKAM